MTEFRLTQISDTHLSRSPRFARLTENFHRISEHIDATRPDILVHTGDLTWDAPTSPDDLHYAKELHAALPVACRYLPGNHDIGDNPTAVGKPLAHRANEKDRSSFIQAFGEDHWQFEAAGWRFIGLNSLIMNTGIASESEQMEWLKEQLDGGEGKPIALFLHKALFAEAPEDPETPGTAIRYVPQPVRAELIELLGRYDVRLVASGHVHQQRDFTQGKLRHVWAPSTGFVFPERIQEAIGTKTTGLAEYRFRPDGFEVRFVRAPGQIDVSLDELLNRSRG